MAIFDEFKAQTTKPVAPTLTKQSRTWANALTAQANAAKPQPPRVAQTPATFGQQLAGVMGQAFAPLGQSLARAGGLGSTSAPGVGYWGQNINPAVAPGQMPPASQFAGSFGDTGMLGGEKMMMDPSTGKYYTAKDYLKHIYQAASVPFTDENGITRIRTMNPYTGNYSFQQMETPPLDQNVIPLGADWGGPGGPSSGDYFNQWQYGMLQWLGV